MFLAASFNDMIVLLGRVDLSKGNIKCLINNISSGNKHWLLNLKTYSGDFSKNIGLIKKIPKDYFSMAYVVNVLQFLNSNELNGFLINLKKIIKKNGYIYIRVENGFTYNDFKSLDTAIFKFNGLYNSNALEIKNKIFNKLQCNINGPRKTNFKSRLFLYPCNIAGINNITKEIVAKQILSPYLLSLILKKYGFKTIINKINKSSGNIRTSFTLIAIKK